MSCAVGAEDRGMIVFAEDWLKIALVCCRY